MTDGDIKWLPLEANPEVFSEYCYKLGMPNTLAWADVLAFEDWAIGMLPQPVYAVTLLFPINDKSEEQKKKDDATPQEIPDKLWFTKQSVPNACGTVAAIHTLANLTGTIPMKDDSFIVKFMHKCKDKTPDDRAKMLEEDKEIEGAHEEAEKKGQSKSMEDDKVDTHFLAFVELDGVLYELDGRKKKPTSHGKLGDKSLIEGAIEVAKQFRDRNPDDLRFAMLALAPAAAS